MARVNPVRGGGGGAKAHVAESLVGWQIHFAPARGCIITCCLRCSGSLLGNPDPPRTPLDPTPHLDPDFIVQK